MERLGDAKAIITALCACFVAKLSCIEPYRAIKLVSSRTSHLARDCRAILSLILSLQRISLRMPLRLIKIEARMIRRIVPIESLWLWPSRFRRFLPEHLREDALQIMRDVVVHPAILYMQRGGCEHKTSTEAALKPAFDTRFISDAGARKRKMSDTFDPPRALTPGLPGLRLLHLVASPGGRPVTCNVTDTRCIL